MTKYIVCECCGREVQKHRGRGHRYCSNRCRLRAWRQRHQGAFSATESQPTSHSFGRLDAA